MPKNVVSHLQWCRGIHEDGEPSKGAQKAPVAGPSTGAPRAPVVAVESPEAGPSPLQGADADAGEPSTYTDCQN